MPDEQVADEGAIIIDDALQDSNADLVNSETFYACSVCSYRSPYRKRVETHVKSHENDSSQSLAEEMDTSNMFVCDICQKALPTSAGLSRHMVRMHNIKSGPGSRILECEVCNYRAIHAHHMSRHLLTHTGEKPYQCPFCEYRCARSDNLENHIKRHTKGVSKVVSSEISLEVTEDKDDIEIEQG